MSTAPTYKPSVYYFRKSLREAATADRAVVICKLVMFEWEQLRAWAAEQEILQLRREPDVSMAYLQATLEQPLSLDVAYILGMYACAELELLKALVRDYDLIPPKWIVAPEEAEDKGWGTSDRAAKQRFETA